MIKIHLGIDDDLSFTVVVAQVDKNNAAVVADTVYPAGDPDFFTHIFLAEFAAGMRSELMHLLQSFLFDTGTCAGKMFIFDRIIT